MISEILFLFVVILLLYQKEDEKGDSGVSKGKRCYIIDQNMKSAFVISGVVVAIIGVVIFTTKKMKQTS